MTILACVLRSGGDFDVSHVDLMRKYHATYLPETDFVCVSDMNGAADKELIHNWPGWWSKIELFRPGLFPVGEQVIYVDLDTVFLGCPDKLLAYEGSFALLRDFYTTRELGLYGSGVMAWNTGNRRLQSMYETFVQQDEKIMSACRRGGDQMFINRHYPGADYIQDVAPDEVVSFKPINARTWRREHPGAETKILCFHGNPRPWEASKEVPWVKEAMAL